MRLILVRHAQPAWAPDGLQDNDPPLTALGSAQAEKVAERRWGHVDEVWVSPLLRTRQTAEPIVKHLGIEPTIRPFLEEIRNPDEWHGSPVEKVEEFFRTIHLRSVEELWDGLPGGESFRHFHSRIALGITAALTEYGVAPNPRFPLWEVGAERTVVIVGHGGTNAVILSHLLGVDASPWEWDRFDSAHTSVATISLRQVAQAGAFGMTGFGDVSHLDPDMVTR